MPEKLIGSLLYGDHPPPKKARPWKDRLKVPLTIGIVLAVIAGVAYTFANFREERQVSRFIESIAAGQYDQAFANWDAGESYTMKEFLEDWGKDGYYTKGMQRADIIDSNSKGQTVIVYVEIDTFKRPIALMVNKESLKLSFSPLNKYGSQ